MSPAEASGLVQSAEVSQTTSAAVAIIGRPQQRKLKVKMSQPTPLSSQVRTPLSSQVSTPLQSRVRSYSRSSVVDCGRPTLKRKLSVTGSEAAELAKFKSTKRTKKYMQRPYEDPDLERTRLNAINAKRNRERKKQEMMVLAEKCDSLSEENKELDRSNRSLEQRLQAAEEEIAFLRRALLGQVGSERPALSEAIKSLTGGSSAPAG